MISTFWICGWLSYILKYDFEGKIKDYIKYKKDKNLNKIYNFYDNKFKNFILFFPINNYFVFKSKYIYIKNFLPKETIFYKNNFF